MQKQIISDTLKFMRTMQGNVVDCLGEGGAHKSGYGGSLPLRKDDMKVGI